MTTPCLLLNATVLLLLSLEREALRIVAEVGALVAGLLAMPAAVADAYDVRGFTDVAPFSSMSLLTAWGLLVLSAGVLALRTRDGPLRVLAESTLGGSVVRRLLPAAVVVPLILGWLRLTGERAGLYDSGFGVAMNVAATIALLHAVIWLTALSLDRAYAERIEAQRRLSEQNALPELTLESMGEGVVVADAAPRGSPPPPFIPT